MARPARSSPKVRLNVEISEEMRKLLSDLQLRVQADSLSEVIRRSLKVYDFYTKEQEQGTKFYLKKQGEDPRELTIL